MTTPIRIDLAGFAREGGLGDHAGLMALCQQADRLGFGGIWFNEFHFQGDRNPYPHTLMLGAEVLARTERLRFGTSILVLPLHHPLMLAEQVAQLDWQSCGRVDVGIGRGTDPGSFAALGIPRDEAPSRYDDALGILLDAWQTGHASSDGPHWRFNDISVGPPCVQRPHPPVYASAVSPESLDVAARHGLPLLLSLEPNEDRQLPGWRAALTRYGQPPSVMQRSQLARYVLTAPRRAEALERLDVLTARLNARRAARAEAKGESPPPARNRADMLAGFAIAGTPDDCAEQIAALCTRIGAHAMRALFSANGLIPMDEALAAMTLFGTETLPLLSTTHPTTEKIP